MNVNFREINTNLKGLHQTGNQNGGEDAQAHHQHHQGESSTHGGAKNTPHQNVSENLASRASKLWKPPKPMFLQPQPEKEAIEDTNLGAAALWDQL